MKREFLIVCAILLILAVAYYLLGSSKVFKPMPTPQPEKEISLAQFTDVVNTIDNFSIVMYSENDENKTRTVFNCGVSLSGSLGGLGKRIESYAIDGGQCFWQDPVNLTVLNLNKSACDVMFKKNYYFEIRYGIAPSKFYDRRAVIYIDENFNKSCSISPKS